MVFAKGKRTGKSKFVTKVVAIIEFALTWPNFLAEEYNWRIPKNFFAKYNQVSTIFHARDHSKTFGVS